MTDRWSPDDLQRIGSADELNIAVYGADDTLRGWLPIWVVCVDDQVYARTWHRRDTGWFGQALRSRRARIRVPGLEIDVIVVDAGAGSAQLRASVDDAYRTKYGAGSTSMVTTAAAATTLRLDVERQPRDG